MNAWKRMVICVVVAGSFALAGIAEAFVTPVSWWTFDESNTGTGTAFDQVDSNPGTFQGTATRTAGLVGLGAALFNNLNGDAVNVGPGTGNNFSTTTGISVEALFTTGWNGVVNAELFRKQDPNFMLLSLQRALSISGFNSPGISFGLKVGGVYSELDMPFDGLAGRPTMAQMTDGNIHHVVATYDSASGLKAFYIDGTLRFSTTLAGLITSGGGANAYIGSLGGGGEPFTGVLDEVAFYNTALSASEILIHYRNTAQGYNYYTPEPGTLTLLGAGLAVLLRRRRRR